MSRNFVAFTLLCLFGLPGLAVAKDERSALIDRAYSSCIANVIRLRDADEDKMSWIEAQSRCMADRIDASRKAGLNSAITPSKGTVQIIPPTNHLTIPPLKGNSPNRPAHRLPNGWSRYEFNGMQYYFVPLGGDMHKNTPL